VEKSTSNKPLVNAHVDQLLWREPHRAVETMNPALLFVMSRHTAESRRVTISGLNVISQLAGFEDYLEADWTRLDREVIFQVMEKLIQWGRSARTRNLYLSFLKGVAKEAFLSQQISAEVLKRIEMVKGEKVTRLPNGRALLKGEVSEVIKACQSQPGLKGARDTAIIALLFGCGLRRAEVVALDLDHVDLAAGSLRVSGKGVQERVVPVPPRTQVLL